MLTYAVGDATAPRGTGIRIIAHVCNDLGAWGRGFVFAVSKLSPLPRRAYLEWKDGRLTLPFELGRTQFVPVTDTLIVANMVAQRGLRGPGNPIPLSYAALATCLAEVAARAKSVGASVHMPRIGAGLAGGNWQVIEPMINAQFSSLAVPVTVYDLPQQAAA